MKHLRRGLIGFALAGVLLGVFPDAAAADNCAGLGDCFATARAAIAASAGLAVLAAMLSLALDFMPIVGTVKGVIELFTGEDLVTGEELAWWERALGIVPFAPAIIGAAGAMARAADRVGDVAGAAGSGGRAADAAGAAGSGGRAADTVGAGRAAGAGDAAGSAGRTGGRAADAGRAGDAAGAAGSGGRAADAGRAGDAAGGAGSGGRAADAAGTAGSGGRAADAAGGAGAGRRTGHAADAGDAAGTGRRAAEGATDYGRRADAGGDAARHGDEAAESGDMTRAREGTRVPPARVENDFGMPLENFAKFQDVARRHDVFIEVRGTNPASLAHLKAGALPKPELIKAKTINEVDTLLGWKASDVGKVGFGPPRLPDGKPPGMSDADWGRVVDRYNQRLNEYLDLKRKMDKLEGSGMIRVGDDGVVVGGPSARAPGGEAGSGAGRPFAGDHDVYRITDAKTGEQVTGDRADEIIDELRHHGVEHGPHRNWEPTTDSDRAIYDRIVDQHTSADAGGGGEGLLRIGPDGSATVSYD